MKKAILSLLMVSVLLVSVSFVMAVKDTTLNFGKELNANQCNAVGAPIVNVVHKVINSVDSGTAGNYWAYEDYVKHIQLFKTSNEGEYCAVVSYEGQFDGVESEQSPANLAPLTGEEDGAFEGGYRMIITGDLLVKPSWKTRGFVGTYDYKCDLSANCPGAVNWVNQYFEFGNTFAYQWWGWIYHGGKCGTWVNADGNNLGDILCS